MALTSDQLHTFNTATKWKAFRAFFSTKLDALKAHAAAAQIGNPTTSATHQFEWRHIYHDKESGFLTLLFLLCAPLGIHYSRHNEFRFVTRHVLTRQQSKQLFWSRALGSVCYHVCFVLLIFCGVGIAIGSFSQFLGKFSLEMTLLTLFCLFAFIALAVAAGKTRAMGLPEQLRPIAKDIFDLVSIKKLPTR